MRTELSDFEFRPRGYGRYKVVYKSPVTGKEWATIIEDMTMIDATKNADQPKRKDLEALKRKCKG